MALFGKKKKEEYVPEPGRDQKNPYLWARRQWNGGLYSSYRNFHLAVYVAVIGVSLSMIMSLVAISQATKPKMLPYIIELRDDGTHTFEGMLEYTRLDVNDAVMRNILKRFITNLRTVSTDKVVLQRMLGDAYYVTTESAQNQISDWLRVEKEPFTLQESGIRRDVRINFFEPINELTWRVEWEEEIRLNGILQDRRPMTGTFGYVQLPTDNPIVAENNPFGVYLTDYHITEKRYQ
jgi:type IV secretory pathway TrbF-like protein